MARKGSGDEGRYEQVVNRLQPAELRKLAVELVRRVFEVDGPQTTPTALELSACETAVAALMGENRQRHPEVLAEARNALMTASLVPSMAAIYLGST